MRASFAAPRRASKNHLVSGRFCFLRRQAFDGYQVFLMILSCVFGLSALKLRQSTALQQRGVL
ncbi:hypothetical protein BN2475_540010 [Paraburkholderia ribeironis]|uniref:Uncharacterized protein n=1 Tax=Paraburkholderia ribeironis TaxID=1247936 RepID=A0A1N7SCV9_9BURK|nr:hypothetical protein BN2475_540010 [Paraburkholderia ribeironis]